MKDSVSEQSFYIESDEEDADQEKFFNEEHEDDDNSDSDSSNGSLGDRQQSKSNSINTSWPQSYRQSIDLYGSVPSPSIGFLGTPSLTRLGSSFLSSSLRLRHTPEVSKPLLPTTAAGEPQLRQSSHSLLPPVSSRKSSVAKRAGSEYTPSSRVAHLEIPCSRRSSFGQAVMNVIPFSFGGQHSSYIMACCVEYIILESDNLSSLFPNANLNLGWYELDSRYLFALITMLAVLPTCWLRDLSVLSYISVGGVIASIVVVLCLFWVGLVDDVGNYNSGSTLNLTTLPVALGLYGYCYSGHAVFPNIYTSMEKPNQFPVVLLTSFAICTLLYAGVAVLGYLMFGESTMSQFTLNMPKDLVASKIAVWTTVVNPFTKFALTLSPVAMSLEELLPPHRLKSHMYPILIRTALVISTLLVGLSIPFFGLVMSLIGSFLTMLVTLILPCACFLSILKGKFTRFQCSLCILIIIVGVVSSVFGSYSALSKIVESLQH